MFGARVNVPGQAPVTSHLTEKSFLKPLLEFIVAGGLATTVKAGLDLLGIWAGEPRRPLLPLDERDRDHLRSLLTADG
ncbi:hypothetical protein GCM10023161_47520 [Mycobacterium paraffinicum]|uniref:Dihydrodipicolinate synthase family protein n=1 Tax=Mycobacterium paraffinicum TaxID=53378 RepID=A0ABP8F6Y0_9MYCO